MTRNAYVHDCQTTCVFARQALLGRTQYKAYMPRTWRYLERNLRDPALAGLKRWFDGNVPPETRP